MPLGMSVIGIVFAALVAIYYGWILFQFLRSRLGPERTVQAQVVGKSRVAGISKTGGTAYRYAVTFEAEGKRRSFYVSEFSWGGYRKGERGQLTYKGKRLIDFH